MVPFGATYNHRRDNPNRTVKIFDTLKPIVSTYTYTYVNMSVLVLLET